MTGSSTSVSSARRALSGACRAFGLIAQAAGILASVVLLVLAASVLLGILLRSISIDNSWTYDLDTFCLIWLAFLGAAYTGYRAAHVTSGISLEHIFGGALVLTLVRFMIVAGFLIVFVRSGYAQWHSSWLFGETTLDVVQWPVWVAKLALPVGGVAWLAGELHKLLAGFLGKKLPSAGH
ncbi:MAG: TRAP transporter small permease [Salinisphaera sp.]|jgi:TRAP-type C4-dicarboxylate transport system permease small subunit|nr:TRAP transporter small permease [Salinisphaera sp.]